MSLALSCGKTVREKMKVVLKFEKRLKARDLRETRSIICVH